MRQLVDAFRRNTVEASKIASVGNRNAKVVEMSIVLINQLNMIISHQNPHLYWNNCYVYYM
jgi:hypothetical protein